MKTIKLTSALVAGALGTVAMTTLMYMAPLLGLPKMDLLYALGNVFPLPLSPYLMGSIVHLAIGVVLAIGYALLADAWLPGPRWVRGALYSLLPWALALVALGPLLMTAQTLLNPSPVAAQAANPCGLSRPAGQSMNALPRNACAVPSQGAVVANPCRPSSPPSNPCGPMKQSAALANPCAPANPAAASTTDNRWIGPFMSLLAHLLYGGVVGLVYRPRYA